jgi:hypothetical protein
LVLHVVAEKCRVLGVSGSARTRDIGSSWRRSFLSLWKQFQ